MEEGLSDVFGLHVEEFHLLAGHVLSLGQLEDVLLSIDQLHRAGVSTQSTNITCLQPAISSNGLLGQLFSLVVAQNHSMSSQPDFSPRSGVSVAVFVVASVTHFRNIG